MNISKEINTPKLASVIPDSWHPFLSDTICSDWFRQLSERAENAYRDSLVYPPYPLIFNALNFFRPEQTRVIILGQDPYPNPGQAHGLCFSVPFGTPPPRSLKNIFRELAADLGQDPPFSGDLSPWAQQGVLLLNTTLTVRHAQAGSHAQWEWERFTDELVTRLSTSIGGLVFILWGNHARKKKMLIHPNNHLILEAAHPSPLSAYQGFFGCKHFSKCNFFLLQQGKQPIAWI